MIFQYLLFINVLSSVGNDENIILTFFSLKQVNINLPPPLSSFADARILDCLRAVIFPVFKL